MRYLFANTVRTVGDLKAVLAECDDKLPVLVDGTHCDRDIRSVSIDNDGLPSYLVIEGTSEGMNN